MTCAFGLGPASQVTDRLATAGLLMVLSKEYPAYFYHCMGLVLLDIGGGGPRVLQSNRARNPTFISRV